MVQPIKSILLRVDKRDILIFMLLYGGVWVLLSFLWTLVFQDFSGVLMERVRFNWDLIFQQGLIVSSGGIPVSPPSIPAMLVVATPEIEGPTGIVSGITTLPLALPDVFYRLLKWGSLSIKFDRGDSHGVRGGENTIKLLSMIAGALTYVLLLALLATGYFIVKNLTKHISMAIIAIASATSFLGSIVHFLLRSMA